MHRYPIPSHPNLRLMLTMHAQVADDRPTFESLQDRLEGFFHSEAGNYTDIVKLLEGEDAAPAE